MAPLFSPNGYTPFCFVAGAGRLTCFPCYCWKVGARLIRARWLVVAVRVLCGLKRTIALDVRKAASESESSWYQVQRAGSVPLICLAVAYADSGLLFILQGIYHEVISPLIPVVVFSAQSLVGIIWIYKASSNSDPSQNQSRTGEVSERIKEK